VPVTVGQDPSTRVLRWVAATGESSPSGPRAATRRVAAGPRWWYRVRSPLTRPLALLDIIASTREMVCDHLASVCGYARGHQAAVSGVCRIMACGASVDHHPTS